MKKTILLLTACLLFAPGAAGVANQNREYRVEIASIPATVDAFVAMRDKVATTPEGGVAMLLVALRMWETSRVEGTKALIVIMDMNLLQQNSGEYSYKGYGVGRSYEYMLGSASRNSPYVPSSYFPGTSPANNYAMGSGPYRLEFTPHRHRPQNDVEHTLFVPSSGADSPRPVQVKKNDKGIWKAANFSSLLVGIRPPASAAPVDEL